MDVTASKRKQRRKPKIEEMKEEGFDHFRACPDSGAVVFVAPPSFAPGVKLQPSEASRKGIHYKTASGHHIPNRGEKVIKAVDSDGKKTRSVWQIADVTKPLAGLTATVRAGNKVVFDEEGGNNLSYIYNKESKAVIPIEENRGQYEFDLFIPRSDDITEVTESEKKSSKSNYRGMWQELDEEIAEDIAQGFTGLV